MVGIETSPILAISHPALHIKYKNVHCTCTSPWGKLFPLLFILVLQEWGNKRQNKEKREKKRNWIRIEIKIEILMNELNATMTTNDGD